MAEKPEPQEPNFDTEQPYAFVQGWLALPAIYLVITLIGALIMLFFVNPTSLEWADLSIYLMDVVFLPIIPFIIYFWWKRKRILPKLMILFFFLIAARQIVYWMNGASISFFDIGFSIVWIVYFFRSKRVKQTFIY